MARRQYRLRYRSEQVSVRVGSGAFRPGRFPHAFRVISTAMLERAPDGELREPPLRTLRRLKVQVWERSGTGAPGPCRHRPVGRALLGRDGFDRIRSTSRYSTRLELYDEIREAHAPVDPCEKAELLELARSASLREDLRSSTSVPWTWRLHRLRTSVARLSNHAAGPSARFAAASSSFSFRTPGAVATLPSRHQEAILST